MEKRTTKERSARAAYVLAVGLTLLGVAAGCEQPLEADAEGTNEALFRFDNDVALEWNEHTIDALIADSNYADPLLASRVLAMVHVAMHDAVNATSYRFFESYAYRERDPLAHPEAAAASAAAHVLSALFPAQSMDMQDKLAQSLSSVPNGKWETRGVALGEDVARQMIALRENDHLDDVVPYTPGNDPGDYQYTTPDFIFRPGFQFVTPWALERADQFRSAPPPALESSEYAQAYEEVRAKGDVDSDTRTDDETAYAHFWYEFSDRGWNRVTRVVAQQEHLGLAHTARLFALVNMAMADSYIAGWDAKFFYDRFRPVTAIHADADGNDETQPDPSFEPLLPTPPVQDYPSTHSVLGAAAAEVLERAFGRRGQHIGFAMTSSTATEPDVEVRSFASFAQAARENADSRVMAGIHFRYATDAGLTLGRAIGAHVFRHELRPRR